MEKKIRELFKMGVAQAIGIIILIAVIFYQGSRVSSYKMIAEASEQSYNTVQLEVVALEKALKICLVCIARCCHTLMMDFMLQN